MDAVPSQLDPNLAFGQGPPMPHRTYLRADEIIAISEKVQTAKPSQPNKSFQAIEMTVIRHAATLSLTPVCSGPAPYDLDADEPRWLQQF